MAEKSYKNLRNNQSTVEVDGRFLLWYYCTVVGKESERINEREITVYESGSKA